MQRILRKRIWRDLKANRLRYLSLGALIALGMYLIVSLVGAADTVIIGIDEKAAENRLEDGEFGVFVPLTHAQEEGLTKQGIILERMFYLDFVQEEDSVLRVFKNRENINRIDLDEGRLARKQGEAVLEKRYCQEQGIAVGDTISIGGFSYQVTGIGTVPDYDGVYKNLTDSSANSKEFGLAFVSAESYETLKSAGKSEKAEEYNYAYLISGQMTDEELKAKLNNLEIEPVEVADPYFQEYWAQTGGKKDEFLDGLGGLWDGSEELSERIGELKVQAEEWTDAYFKTDLSNLTRFLRAKDNPRIKASGNDQVINKLAGLIAGIIVMVLFTYVISVFVIHGIEKESSMIGTFYALGAGKKDLMLHYLTLPVAVTFVAGTLGTFIGYSTWGIAVQMGECYDYFSIPALPTVYSSYLLAYGILMPPAVAAVVNGMVIWKRLSRPVLELIRNEPKKSRIRNLDLRSMGFVGRFRIRQMLREVRTVLTVILGMFIGMLIMMLGINCYVMCRHISEENKEDTKYEYMYTYKYPEKKLPEGGEACYAKTLKKENLGFNLDVTLLGIDHDNPYFDVQVPDGKSKAAVSSAMAQRYHLTVGDHLLLTDGEEDMDYAFSVEEIVQYSPGLYVFMNIDDMRELFGEPEDYYNVVLADHNLDIEAGRLYAASSKEDVSKSSDVFVSMMMPMIVMLIGVSVLIFCVVMYLMMNVMLDRSAFGISLIRIFGYRTEEIRKLYINGNFYLVAVGAAICIPLAKKLMDVIYPLLVSNVACAMNLTFTWPLYLGIYLSVIVLYLLINQFLVRRLKKILPADVLKDRE